MCDSDVSVTTNHRPPCAWHHSLRMLSVVCVYSKRVLAEASWTPRRETRWSYKTALRKLWYSIRFFHTCLTVIWPWRSNANASCAFYFHFHSQYEPWPRSTLTHRSSLYSCFCDVTHFQTRQTFHIRIYILILWASIRLWHPVTFILSFLKTYSPLPGLEASEHFWDVWREDGEPHKVAPETFYWPILWRLAEGLIWSDRNSCLWDSFHKCTCVTHSDQPQSGKVCFITVCIFHTNNPSFFRAEVFPAGVTVRRGSWRLHRYLEMKLLQLNPLQDHTTLLTPTSDNSISRYHVHTFTRSHVHTHPLTDGHIVHQTSTVSFSFKVIHVGGNSD